MKRRKLELLQQTNSQVPENRYFLDQPHFLQPHLHSSHFHQPHLHSTHFLQPHLDSQEYYQLPLHPYH